MPNDAVFPCNVWGDIISQRLTDIVRISRVRVDKAKGTGYILITEDASGVFDTWVEFSDDVLDFLADYEIRWQTVDQEQPSSNRQSPAGE